MAHAWLGTRGRCPLLAVPSRAASWVESGGNCFAGGCIYAARAKPRCPQVSCTFRNAVFNWYLYTYGIVAICLFVAARLLAPPRNLVLDRNIRPLLYTLSAILAFLLL